MTANRLMTVSVSAGVPVAQIANMFDGFLYSFCTVPADTATWPVTISITNMTNVSANLAHYWDYWNGAISGNATDGNWSIDCMVEAYCYQANGSRDVGWHTMGSATLTGAATNAAYLPFVRNAINYINEIRFTFSNPVGLTQLRIRELFASRYQAVIYEQPIITWSGSLAPLPFYNSIKPSLQTAMTDAAFVGSEDLEAGNAAVSLLTEAGASWLFGSYMWSGGGEAKRLHTVTTNTTLGKSHRTVLVDASANAVTITLPSAASAKKTINSANASQEYIIKKIDSSANSVTIDAAGSETIDGATTKVLTSRWQAVHIQSDGTSWFILASQG